MPGKLGINAEFWYYCRLHERFSSSVIKAEPVLQGLLSAIFSAIFLFFASHCGARTYKGFFEPLFGVFPRNPGRLDGS